MEEVDLLRSLPRTKRNIHARAKAKDPAIIAEAKRYGQMYFDGPREYGYGGYNYDGRWLRVARDIIDQYTLDWRPIRVLDVGCAKGFLVHDFMVNAPNIDAYGLDVSGYALSNCLPSVVGRLHLGTAMNLPFPDKSFDLVVSINTLHNLPRAGVITALREIQRVGKRAFAQVDSYHTAEQKALFEEWVLTAEFYDYPSGWLDAFDEAGYTGDFAWTIIE